VFTPADGVFWRREDAAVILVGINGAIRLSGAAVDTWDALVAIGSGHGATASDPASLPDSVRALAQQLIEIGYLIPGDGGDTWANSRLGHVPAAV
jgi:hypothetical protein